MAALSFSKVGNEYVATYTANGNFALHIERSTAGVVKLEQSSVSGGGYAPVLDFPAQIVRNHKVVDVTITGEVFPMYIKVTCETQPTSAVVTEA